MVARLEVELAAACRRSRARRSRPRRRPAPRRRRGWGSSISAGARPPRPRSGPPRPPSPRRRASLVRASSAAFSSPCACGICLPSCFCSARLASKVGDRRYGGRCRRPAPGRPRRRTARAWPGRLARGRGRRAAPSGRSRRQGYRAGGAVAARQFHTLPRVRSGAGGPGILARVLDRPRPVILAWAGVCAALFVVLAFLVHLDRAPLSGFDDLGRSAESWARQSTRSCTLLRGIEVGVRHPRHDDPARCWSPYRCWCAEHRRAAVFTVVVMVTTVVCYTGDQGALRARAGRRGRTRSAQLDLPVLPVRARGQHGGVRRRPDRAGDDAGPARQPASGRLRRCGAAGAGGRRRPGAAGPALPHRRDRRLAARRLRGAALAGGLQPAAAQPCRVAPSR